MKLNEIAPLSQGLGAQPAQPAQPSQEDVGWNTAAKSNPNNFKSYLTSLHGVAESIKKNPALLQNPNVQKILQNNNFKLIIKSFSNNIKSRRQQQQPNKKASVNTGKMKTIEAIVNSIDVKKVPYMPGIANLKASIPNIKTVYEQKRAAFIERSKDNEKGQYQIVPYESNRWAVNKIFDQMYKSKGANNTKNPNQNPPNNNQTPNQEPDNNRTTANADLMYLNNLKNLSTLNDEQKKIIIKLGNKYKLGQQMLRGQESTYINNLKSIISKNI